MPKTYSIKYKLTGWFSMAKDIDTSLAEFCRGLLEMACVCCIAVCIRFTSSKNAVHFAH